MKNILIKFSAAVLAFLGISMTGVTPVSHPVKAANKRVKVISKRYVTVWSNYRSGHHKVTHMKKGTTHFVYQTAKDSVGNLWYRIGKNEWGLAKYFTKVEQKRAAVKKVKKTTKTKKATKAVSAATLAASWSAPMGSKARAKVVVSLAKAQVGKSYIKGSKGPDAFDNASLVAYVYKQAVGVNTGSTAKAQATKGIAVKSGFTEGDLLFWGSKSNPYNVAIYVGNGQYVMASGDQQGVVQTSLSTYFWPSHARRVL